MEQAAFGSGSEALRCFTQLIAIVRVGDVDERVRTLVHRPPTKVRRSKLSDDDIDLVSWSGDRSAVRQKVQNAWHPNTVDHR